MAMTSLQQLRSVLLAERDTAAALVQLLKKERGSLTQSNIDVISNMSAAKQPLVVKLEQLGRQREAIIQMEGFSAGKEGLEAFIENQSSQDAAELNRIVKSLRLVAKACHENNQVNGGIVNVNRQYLQKAMSILRGKDVTAAAYGPGGEYTSQIVRQPLLGRV